MIRQRPSALPLFLLICVFSQATAQELRDKAPTLYAVFIAAGYADAPSSNVSEYYDILVDSYRSSNISLQTQTGFGRTLVVSGGILLTRLERIWFGVSIGYWYSPAYSIYEDYAGSVKVRGKITSYDISIRIRGRVTWIFGLPLNFSVQPGMSHTSASINRELRLTGSPAYDYTREWSVSSWGPCCQATLGTSIPLGDFRVLLEGGYRLSWNKNDEGIEPGPTNRRLYVPIDIGQSGVLVLASCEMQF